MSRTVVYLGHTIKSAPLQQFKTGRWKVEVSIFWTRDGVTTIRSFSADGSYSTEAEADLHGIAFGERIIKVKVPGVTLA